MKGTHVLIPEVGDIVTYYNDHGFPRAAVVTANKESLRGEKHVPLIIVEHHLHLFIMSPLPRQYNEMFVPSYEMLQEEALVDPWDIPRKHVWLSKDTRIL